MVASNPAQRPFGLHLHRERGHSRPAGLTQFAILATALVTSSAVPVTRVIPERRYDAQLVRVVDGDTIEVTVTARTTTHLPGQDVELATSVLETVRLAGVNAPEIHGKCEAEKQAARAARLFLEEQLRGVSFVLVTRGADETERYGRVLADVEVGGASVVKELISKGLADPYDGGKRDVGKWCR